MDRNPLKAVIFDMDGVIIDTCELHRQAWQEAGTVYGYKWPKAVNFKKDVFGTVSADSARLLFGEHVLNNPELIPVKDDAYERILNEQVQNILVPGVVDFINSLNANGVRLALATSARKEEARFVMESAGIAHLFEVMVDISQVVHAKPHPELYLTALAKLNLPPDDCIAFEDSLSGYKAVVAAGLRCVLVKTTMDDEKIEMHQMRCEALINCFLPEEISGLLFAPDLIPNVIQ
jgi:HAD superfamily hydrolase (TIGR01509 family)